jgi:hypothetical protein
VKILRTLQGLRAEVTDSNETKTSSERSRDATMNRYGAFIMRPYIEPKTLPPAMKKAAHAFRRMTTTIRLLPDFLIIGAARCAGSASSSMPF